MSTVAVPSIATVAEDFEGEEGELSLPKGTKVIVVKCDDDGWWTVHTKKSIGIFPGSYLDVTEVVKLPCNAQIVKNFREMNLNVGEIVQVQDISEEGWMIESKSNLGFCTWDYLDIVKDVPKSTQQQPQQVSPQQQRPPSQAPQQGGPLGGPQQQRPSQQGGPQQGGPQQGGPQQGGPQGPGGLQRPPSQQGGLQGGPQQMRPMQQGGPQGGPPGGQQQRPPSQIPNNSGSPQQQPPQQQQQRPPSQVPNQGGPQGGPPGGQQRPPSQVPQQGGPQGGPQQQRPPSQVPNNSGPPNKAPPQGPQGGSQQQQRPPSQVPNNSGPPNKAPPQGPQGGPQQNRPQTNPNAPRSDLSSMSNTSARNTLLKKKQSILNLPDPEYRFSGFNINSDISELHGRKEVSYDPYLMPNQRNARSYFFLLIFFLNLSIPS